MKQTALFLLVAVSLTYAATKCYDVVPYQNCIGVQEDGEVGISQSYTNVLDSLTMVSIWVGDKGNGEAFDVLVQDAETQEVVADTQGIVPTASWSWLDMPLNPYLGRKPVRGKTYKVIFTRATGAAVDGLLAEA